MALPDIYLGSDQSAHHGREEKPACCVLLSSTAHTWWQIHCMKESILLLQKKTALSHWSAAPEPLGLCVRPAGGWAWEAEAAAIQRYPQNPPGRISSAVGKTTAKLRAKPGGCGVKWSLAGQAGMVCVQYSWHGNLLREPWLLPHWFQVPLGITCTCMAACLAVPRQSGKIYSVQEKRKASFSFQEMSLWMDLLIIPEKNGEQLSQNLWQIFVGGKKENKTRERGGFWGGLKMEEEWNQTAAVHSKACSRGQVLPLSSGVCSHTDIQTCRWQVCYTAPAELLQLNCPSRAGSKSSNPDPHFQSPLGLSWLQLSLWWFCWAGPQGCPLAEFLYLFPFLCLESWSDEIWDRSCRIWYFGHQIVSGWIKSRSLKACAYLDHMGRWIRSDRSRAFWTVCAQ